MVVTATLTAGKVSGYVVNIGDLSPNYAGTLMGISNTIANIPGFLAPLVNGVIIGEKVVLFLGLQHGHGWRLTSHPHFLSTAA